MFISDMLVITTLCSEKFIALWAVLRSMFVIIMFVIFLLCRKSHAAFFTGEFIFISHSMFKDMLFQLIILREIDIAMGAVAIMFDFIMFL